MKNHIMAKKKRQSYEESQQGKEKRQSYEESQPGRDKRKSYEESSEGKKRKHNYVESQHGKEKIQSYEESQHGKEKRQSYEESKQGKEKREAYKYKKLLSEMEIDTGFNYICCSCNEFKSKNSCMNTLLRGGKENRFTEDEEESYLLKDDKYNISLDGNFHVCVSCFNQIKQKKG